MKKPEQRVVRAAMRLYRYWVQVGAYRGTPNDWCEAGHWYPLNSEKQALAFGKACAAYKAALSKRGRG